MANDDPVINRIAVCPKCTQPMGALRVYEGTKDGQQHLRGRIAQTCTDYQCHKTIFHSEVSYLADDGEKLIQRIRAREIGVPIPEPFLNTPLRIIAPLPAPNGPIDCRGNCQTSSGNSVRGSQACIEFKCKKCCTDAFHTARRNNTPRDPCKTHKVAAVCDAPVIQALPALQIALPQSQPAVPARRYPSPPPTLPSLSQSTNGSDAVPNFPIATQATVTLAPPRLHSPAKSQNHNPPPRNVQAQTMARNTGNTNTSKGKEKERVLAQPMGMSENWLKAQANAILDDKGAEDLKVRNSRYGEEIKRTVEFVVYFKEDTEPLITKLFIDTYPKLKLEALPLFVKNFKLNENSLFDYWDYPHWTTVTPSSIMFVEKDQPILLRHRPSLFEQLSMEKCPGLSDTIHLRLRSRSKRAADTALVSPLKKVPRGIDQVSANEKAITKPNPARALEAQAARLPSEPLQSAARSISSAQPRPQEVLASGTLAATAGNAAHDSLSTFSVSAWKAGNDQIDRMRDEDSKVTEASAFPIVFGIRYVKSTVCKYKRLWKKAPKKLQDHFLKLGDSKAASLNNFSIVLRDGASGVGVASDVDSDSSIPPSLVPSLPANVSSNTPRKSPEPFPDLPSPLQFNFNHGNPINPSSVGINVKKEAIHVDIDLEGGDSETDFTKLCSFCDQPLPDTLSQFLLELRAKLETTTWSDPMPENPLHRSAPSFTVYLEYCTRHEFETT
ncbi:hypothetical protein BDZ97DRAFT_1772186, partial [Flammula alnicola]